MRVVGGSAGGLRIRAPRGVRPTTDRVREALFAKLGDLVRGAAVLDLYAGSGALGIEAASRGARSVVLVEADRLAAQACRDNLEATGLAVRARVMRSSVEAFCRRRPPTEAPFDVVIVDPPYADAALAVAQVLEAMTVPGWITSEALVVVEVPRDARLDVPAGWEEMWRRRYGGTLVVALHVVASNPKAVSVP